VTTYEDSGDRERQARAGWEIANSMGCQVVGTPTLAKCDYVFVRDDTATAVGEFKYRRAKYPTLTIDQKKIHDVLDAGELLKVGAFLFVQWGNEPLRFTQLTEAGVRGYRKGTQSLNEPRDTNDVDDPVYHIPVEEFRELP
jgi:hypothetical protein